MNRKMLGIVLGLLAIAVAFAIVLACGNPPQPTCAEGQIEVSPAQWIVPVEGHYIYADKVEVLDHEGYYSCPHDWTLIEGNMCHKKHNEDKPATWNEPTYKMVCPEGYDKHGKDECRQWVDEVAGYWIAPVCRAPVVGCMDEAALNFDPAVEIDDGTCEYAPEPVLGCTDLEALNYDENATQDDGTCQYEQPTEEPTEEAIVVPQSTAAPVKVPKTAW